MDFDGDAVTIQLVPESSAEDTYKKMSPRYVNVYKKNRHPIFPFNHECLNGLCVASEYTPDDPEDLKDPKHFYTDYVELLKDVEVNKKIKIGTPIVFTGKIDNIEYQNKITTYGRIRVSKILGVDMDLIHILPNEYSRIDAKAASKLSAYLNKEENGVEIRKELQKFALRAVTLAGVVTFDYKTLYTDTNTELYNEICKIADSKELTDQQKLALLTEKYEKYEKEIESGFSKDLKNELDRAARVKISSISALNMPQLIISGIDEKPIITRGSLLEGYNEKDMIYHSIENRSLQSIKQSGVPSSGYLRRQFSFLMNNFIYQSGEDIENEGLLIPRYKAVGRTAPNGKIYPEVTRESEDDLVLVRSIITKTKGDLSVVTPDLLGTHKDFTDGAAIGASYATSLTESTTQGALGLKHGGHERKFDQTGYLKAPKDCTFREDGKWIYLKVKGKSAELKYPRPDNIVKLNISGDTFKAGENICCAYNTTSPIYELNCLISLTNAKPSLGHRYYEKETVLVSDCYALEDGIIHYEEDKAGNIRVYVGTIEYLYNPLCMYYYPEGTSIKKFDRFCSGVVNMQHVIKTLGTKLNDIYLVFRKQFFELTDHGFLKNGVVAKDAIDEPMLELLFISLTRVSYNSKTNKIEEIEFQGTQKGVLGKKSFFTTLAYGWSANNINKALRGETNLSSDIMTQIMLGLLLQDDLDTKK